MHSKQFAGTHRLKTITVQAHARLHMGFFDLQDRLDCKFGGLGLALTSPVAEIEASASDEFFIVGDFDAKSIENVAKLTELLLKNLGLSSSVRINIKRLIPSHVGLGSGTQLALSLITLFNTLYDLNLDQSQITRLSGRGARSGIGLGAFAQGGFLVDTGKQAGALPEIALRNDFPTDWRVLLVSDSSHVGVHGAVERQAFQTLKPMQSSLKSMVLGLMVPALQREDLLAFGAYMADLQAYNGTYFSPIQGGMYASRKVENALSWLQQNGVACAGQSSWGPTGFAVVENEAKANLHLEQLKKRFAGESDLSIAVTQGYNQGATIKVTE